MCLVIMLVLQIPGYEKHAAFILQGSLKDTKIQGHHHLQGNVHNASGSLFCVGAIGRTSVLDAKTASGKSTDHGRASFAALRARKGLPRIRPFVTTLTPPMQTFWEPRVLKTAFFEAKKIGSRVRFTCFAACRTAKSRFDQASQTPAHGEKNGLRILVTAENRIPG